MADLPVVCSLTPAALKTRREGLFAFEKLTPFGARGARISGVLLIATALWMLVR